MPVTPAKPSDTTVRRWRDNILTAYERSTADQRSRGAAWYTTAHQLAGMLADGDTRTGAGVIAALSANKSWALNQKLATRAFAGNVSGHTGDTLRKVAAILDGTDPTRVLPQHAKTGHFFRCIADPLDPSAVVIDRHAHDVAVGKAHGDTDRGLSSMGRYDAMATAYRMAADRLALRPMEVQATVWLVQVETITGTGTRSNEHKR